MLQSSESTPTAVPVSVRARARPAFGCLSSTVMGAPRVTVSGELDVATAPQLASALDLVGAGDLVVLDLRGLAFADCAGVHVIMAAHLRALQAGGRLVVVRGPSNVERLLALVGLADELELVDRPPRPRIFSPVID